MNAITPFVFEDTLVRAIERQGQPWFVGSDVCKALDIRNHNDALKRLDEDEKGVGSTDTLGGQQTVVIVSEPGVFRLIFTSRKPEAERFKRWLAHDVLPALRRDGFYATKPAGQAGAMAVTAEAVPVITAKLQMVREARHLFGHERARALWQNIGLPLVRLPQHSATAEAHDCLALLLDAEFNETLSLRAAITEAMDGNEVTAQNLRNKGIVVGGEGFAVLNRHPHVQAIYQGSMWAHFQWAPALRRLDGALPQPAVRAGDCVSRATFVPDTWLDWRRHELN